jgi:ubiquitin C-terminal hydrolase
MNNNENNTIRQLQQMSYFNNINVEKVNQWLQHFNKCNENEWRMHREYGNNEINMFKSGLKLFRNTCYINTTFQCLNGCLPFVEYLFLLFEQYNSLILQDEFDFLREYMRYLCGYNKFYPLHNTEEDFKYFIQESFFDTFRQLKYGDQQDISEFFIYLLNYLEEACKLIDITIANPLRMHNGVQDAEQFRLKCLFGNSLQNKIQCLTCNHIRSSIQEDSFLSVQINNKNNMNNYSLNTALDEFFSLEEITDPNEYFNCRKCQKISPNRKSAFKRRFYLAENPFILIIQLKRFGVSRNFFLLILYRLVSNFIFGFQYDSRTGQPYKICDKISLPNELDLNKYLSEEVKISNPNENYIYDPDDYIYDLKSIAAHYGNGINSGHYKGNISFKIRLEIESKIFRF